MYKDIPLEDIKLDITLGYMYFIDKQHPLASSVGKVMLHRHIASVHSGHWLSSEEQVHHIDEDKLNNNPDNLRVMSAQEHSKLHKPGLPKVVLTCLCCGNCFEVPNGAQNIRSTCSILCNTKLQRKFEVSKESLEILLWNKSAKDIAYEFGVSDTAIRKRAKRLGCLVPPPYYHNKTSEYREKLRKENNIPDLSP